LGLPTASRIAYVVHATEYSQESSRQAGPDAELPRNVKLLQDLRPELRIEVLTADVHNAVNRFPDQSIDVVFLPEGRESSASLADRLAAWRPKILPVGRLSGNGWGSREWDVFAAAMRFTILLTNCRRGWNKTV
jgi:hypothetical protein